MMKIYTKRGDEGQTGLLGDVRVSKDHLRIQAYGTLDELNASLGLTLAAAAEVTAFPDSLRKCLQRIQAEIFQLGSELATPAGKSIRMTLVSEEQVAQLESEIDQFEEELPALKTFILPGGAPASAHLHLARTISRRAEREMVHLHHEEPLRTVVLQYINRLSDHLFVSARYSNFCLGLNDELWISPQG